MRNYQGLSSTRTRPDIAYKINCTKIQRSCCTIVSLQPQRCSLYFTKNLVQPGSITKIRLLVLCKPTWKRQVDRREYSVCVLNTGYCFCFYFLFLDSPKSSVSFEMKLQLLKNTLFSLAMCQSYFLQTEFFNKSISFV